MFGLTDQQILLMRVVVEVEADENSCLCHVGHSKHCQVSNLKVSPRTTCNLLFDIASFTSVSTHLYRTRFQRK
jgi:hypothetical protein